MAYSEQSETVFTYYDSKEEELIESWLTKNGYTWWRPTVCGDCCGMYEEYYCVNGIFGKWESEKDRKSFEKFARKNGIPFSEDSIKYGTINPRESY